MLLLIEVSQYYNHQKYKNFAPRKFGDIMGFFNLILFLAPAGGSNPVGPIV